MHKKFQWRRYLVALFAGIFAVAGLVVAIDAPAKAALGDTSEIDYALSLNAGQAVHAPDANSLDLSANLTAEFWFKTSTHAVRYFFNKETAYQFATDANGTFMYAFLSGGTWNFNSTGIVEPLNEWVHIALTKAGTTTSLHINGQKVWSQTGGLTSYSPQVTANPATIDNKTSSFMIGGRAWINDGIGSASAHFDGGVIDEFKLWSTDRSAYIATDMHEKATSSAEGLVGYWNFNEGTASGTSRDLNDRSGLNNHLQFFGTPTASNGNFVDVKSTKKLNGKTVITFPRTYLPGVAGWTVPAGVSKAEIFAIGGGAGGGGGGYGTSPYVGGGGGGGGGGQARLSAVYLTPGDKHLVQVGAGGLGGVQGVSGGSWGGSPGKSGGDSKFGTTVSAKRGFGGWGAGLSDSRRITGRTLTSVYNPETDPIVTNQYQDQNGGQGGQSGVTLGSLGFGTAQATPGAGGGGAGSAAAGTTATSASSFGVGGAGTAFLGSTYGAGANGGVANSGAAVSTSSINSGNGGAGGNGSTGSGVATAGASGSAGIVIVSYASTDDSAFDFSGENRLVTASKQVIPDLSSFTFETWLHPDSLSTTSWNDIFRQEASTSNLGAFGLSAYCGYLQVIFYPSSGAGFNTTPNTCNPSPSNEPLMEIKAGRWTHVAVSITYTAGTPATYVLRVFVNGAVAMAPITITTSGTLYSLGSANLSIAANGSKPSTQNWDGKLDQIKVWTSALSQAEILRSMHTYSSAGVVDTSGSILRAHYDFNTTNGSVLQDQTGNGYDFALKSGATSPSIHQIAQETFSAGNTAFKIEKTYLTPWGGWISPINTSVANALIVAGGGGAGKSENRTQSPVGGSGGGGGVQSLTAQSLVAGTLYPVVVGAGGPGATAKANDSSTRNGQPSTFNTTTALGGGGGGSSTHPGAGGSTVATGGGGGGVASYNCSSYTNGGGVATSGLSGGQGILSWGGAGGGAGGASPALNCTQQFGTSGAGVTSSISGASLEYGRGGYAGFAQDIPTSNSNPGSGGSVSYNAATGNGSGYSGIPGVVIVSAKTHYGVSFNANGGSGALATQYIPLGNSAALTSNSSSTIYRNSYAFKGWSTTSTGAVERTDSESFAPTSDMTLYAVWELVPLINLDAASTSSLPATGLTWTSIAPGTSNLTSTTIGGGSYTSGSPNSLYLPANAYVDMGANNAANVAGAITVEVWAKCSAFRSWDWNILASKWFSSATSGEQNGAKDWHFGIQAGKLNLYTTNSDNKTSNTTWDFTKCSSWNQYVFTIDPANNDKLTFYVNGVADGSYTGVTHTATTTAKLLIGDGRVNPVGFQGYYSKFRMYNTALSATQIANNFSTYSATLPGNYTVTYDYNGATANADTPSETFTVGGSALTLPSPTKTGYTFAGWYTDATFTSASSIGNATYSPTSSVTAFAKWTENSLNVTWDSNGGSAIAATTTPTGGSISSAPSDPTKDGYVFEGWYSNAGLTTAVSFPFTHGKNVDFSLYAKWSNGTYTITYDYNGADGGTRPTTASYTTGGATITLPVPTKTGWTFEGWFAEALFSTAVTGTQTPIANKTLFAKWSPRTYTITYHYNGADGGQTNASADFTTGGTPIALTVPTKTGHSFDGWFAEAGLTTAVSGAQSLTANQDLYAKWSANNYTVTYKPGTHGIGNDIVDTFTFGGSVTLRGTATAILRAGYTISGWTTNDGAAQTSAIGAPYNSAANVILYPVWSANTNTVTFDNQNGSAVTTATFNTGGTLNLPVAPNKNGYTFQGWFTESVNGSLLGLASTTISPTATDDFNIFAQWTADNYSASYSTRTLSSGAAPDPTYNYNIGGYVVIPGNTGNMAINGYSFGGWTVAQDGTGTTYNSGERFLVGNSNMVFWAKWLPNTYTVTYNVNGAAGAASRTSDSYTSGETAITLPAVGTMIKTGYTFQGWSATPTGSVLAGTYTTTSNATLYAKWQIKAVTVTYAPGNASTWSFTDFPSPVSSTYGADVSLSGSIDSSVIFGPNNAVYAFVGWNDGTSTFAAGENYQLGENNVTLTARWVQVFGVRYAFNGGTPYPSELQTDGQCLTSVNAELLCTNNQQIEANRTPTRAGYNFAGWKAQDNSIIAAGSTFTVTANRFLLYAQWTALPYSVSYSSAGSVAVPATSTKYIGDAVTLGAALTRTGYTFNGWSDGVTTYGAGTDYQVGSTDVNFSAVWIADIYSISYDWNGGTGSAQSNTSYTVGTGALTLPGVGNHVKDGFNFAGWSESPNGLAVANGYAPTASKTLYAVWGTGSYAVTFNGHGGTASASSASVVNGGSIVLPSVSRANFVFEGWYTDATAGTSVGREGATYQPGASTTLHARWTQLSLYGIDPAHLTYLNTITARDLVDQSFTGGNGVSSVTVDVPAGTFVDGTQVKIQLIGDFSRAQSLMSGNNYLVSMAVSWLAPDGTVPNTNTGKTVGVTIRNASIKAGMSVYTILGTQVAPVGIATQDGVVTLSLEEDPEIVIAATKPDAPTVVSATAGSNTSAVVSWNAPGTNGGSTVTGYTVTSSTGQTCPSVTTTCTFTGLTPGATYTFRVTARNSVGTSVFSASSAGLTMAGVVPTSPNMNSFDNYKAPLAVGSNGMTVVDVSKKKVATTGGSVVKISTQNMDDIKSVTVDGKKAKILGIVDGEIKIQMPINASGDAKIVFTGPNGQVALEQVISYEAPKPVDVVATTRIPQGNWSIASLAVQDLKKTLLKHPDTALITCVGYQSYAYDTPFDALVAQQRAKTACTYLAAQLPNVAIRTTVVRTKLVGPASRKLKVTFSAVR